LVSERKNGERSPLLWRLLAENWSRHTAELASLVVLSLLGKWPIGAVQDAKRSELLEQVHRLQNRNSGNSRNHQRQHHRYDIIDIDINVVNHQSSSSSSSSDVWLLQNKQL